MSRRRFVWRDGGLVEVSPDYTGAERKAPVPTEEVIYGGVAATDGTPINTRKRHREYMKENNLAMYSDFNWERLAKERENIGHTPEEHRERVQQLGEAAYQLRNKRQK